MIPRATYRIQLHKDFTFADAERIVPYLADLGISHLYASPILTARLGSTHGYDVVDPSAVNPELGGEDGLRRMVSALHARGLGLVVDIVPNHMGVGGADNLWWLDLLRQGRGSDFADFFDIDWDPSEPSLKGKILAPFLGKPYGRALADGEITLVRDEQHGWVASYFHHVFPIRPEDAETLDADPNGSLPRYDTRIPEGCVELHGLLERQHYRLAWWRTAGDLINWRRFFDVTELATLQADRPEVFDGSHDVVLRLYAEGLIDGLRVDHVDGLADPGGYCRRLRAELSAREHLRPADRRGRAWLLVEKILAPGEQLEPSWQTDGTTGYDFMNEVSLVLHDASGCAELAQDWARRTGRPAVFAEEEKLARAEIVERAFSAQLDGVVDALCRLATADVVDRDRPRAALRRCLVKFLTHFPRYRSYAADTVAFGVEALHHAIEAAGPSCLPGDRDHLPRLADWLGPIDSAAPDAELRRLAITRFEQLSAPVAAKSMEDTAFYRHGPILSRNDVGFDPGHGGGSIEDWHAACALRAEAYPRAMLATSTHDHKRGQDLRARLAVLSERHEDWTSGLDRWRRVLADRPRASPPSPTVDPADEIMLLQTIVGAWPRELRPDAIEDLRAFGDRLAGWQQKALREAKLRSSWDAPDEGYEQAAAATLRAILLDPTLADLRAEIATFARSLMPAAISNGLTQTVLALCAPGVPDIYQGTEFLDLSLVDPDNRRPVDYERRVQALAQGQISADDPDILKQRVIASLLRFRCDDPALFLEGGYRPLEVTGEGADRVVAFARLGKATAVVAICPRLVASMVSEDRHLRSEVMATTRVELPSGFVWRDLIADRPASIEEASPSVAHLLGDAPVAVLAGRMV